MKRHVVIAAVLLTAVGVYAQGTIQFNNRVTGTDTSAAIVAPIYGPNATDASMRKVGQAPASTSSFPGGTTDYAGHTGLIGSGFTLALFAGAAGTPDSGLQMIAMGTFRTSTAGAGFNIAPAAAPVVPGVPEGGRAQIQLRAWDNRGGQIATWDQALLAWQSGQINAGMGDSFLSLPLGGVLTTAPNLVGMTSFNIYTVPEPSTIALGILGGLGTLLLLRRRK